MKDKENRKAYFRCVIVFIDSQSNEYIFDGEVLGEITYEILGNKGFGYDPIFLYKPLNKTFAQIDIEIKNQISHRANALKKLKEFLIKNYL
jgi:XTP/dITP diphosphohydrolase